MSDLRTDGAEEAVREVQTARGRLTISARLTEDWDENPAWELAIMADNGFGTHWMDWFDSAQAAIQAGLTAINEEGVDRFFEDPDMPAFHEIEWTTTDDGRDKMQKPLAFPEAGVISGRRAKPVEH